MTGRRIPGSPGSNPERGRAGGGEVFPLSRWPREVGGSLEPLGNAGGFSGARLWRVGGAFCLRAAPADPTAVAARHRWMREAREAGLTFVPAVVPTTDGASFVVAGDVWELQSWMPGVADYREAPSPVRLAAACTALARLHAVWRRHRSEARPAPVVQRRLAALGDGVLHRRLLAYADQPFPVHPCLVDVWHDHVLFTGDEVTGVVDYAAMRLDVPHADLARLLGSLVGDDDAGWAAGLEAYGRLLPVPDVALVRLLDRAGTLAAFQLWERRAAEGRVISEAGRNRLEGLRRRVQGWGTGAV